jgi:hypothetical protein
MWKSIYVFPTVFGWIQLNFIKRYIDVSEPKILPGL